MIDTPKKFEAEMLRILTGEDKPMGYKVEIYAPVKRTWWNR